MDEVDIPLAQRRFVLLKNGGRDDGADVLGGPVDWGNCFISLYTVVIDGHKQKHELGVHESTLVTGGIGFHEYRKKEKVSYKLLRTK